MEIVARLLPTLGSPENSVNIPRGMRTGHSHSTRSGRISLARSNKASDRGSASPRSHALCSSMVGGANGSASPDGADDRVRILPARQEALKAGDAPARLGPGAWRPTAAIRRSSPPWASTGTPHGAA